MRTYRIGYSMDTPFTNNIVITSVGDLISGISLYLEGLTLDIINSMRITANYHTITLSGNTMRILNILKGNNNPATIFHGFPAILLHRFYSNMMINVYSIVLILKYDINLFARCGNRIKKTLIEHCYIEDISNIILEYGTYGAIGEITLTTQTDTDAKCEHYAEYEVVICPDINVISLDLNKAEFSNVIIAFMYDNNFVDILIDCKMDMFALDTTCTNNIYTLSNIVGCSKLSMNITPQLQTIFLHVITY